MTGTVLTDDGCRLWASTSGQGVPLVCCHGGPGLWDMLGVLDGMLGDAVAVHHWDQRGGGRSERRGPYTTARFLADLDAVRRWAGLERMALLGHSWGADLALAYALAHPERVSGLVYVAGIGLGMAWKPAHKRAIAERLGPHLERYTELEALPTWTAEEEREAALLQWSTEFTNRDTALANAERMADPWFPIGYEANRALSAELRQPGREQALTAACRELMVPTLIVDGAHDPRPRWAVDSLEASLPDVRRVTLDAGHLPWVEDPTGFETALREFLVPSERS